MSGTLRFAGFIFLFCLALAKVLSSGAHHDPSNAALRPRAGEAVAAPIAPTRANLPLAMDEVRIAANAVGQYTTDVLVNGARLSRMMVDTGATLVALSYEDAEAAGFYLAPADYKYTVSTANGVARVARVRLNSVRIGNITIYDVDAVVGNRGALSESLLGMTFLSRLHKFSVESGALVLRR